MRRWLDCDAAAWTSDVLAAAGVEESIGRDDGWYVGARPMTNPGVIAATIGSALTSTIASAATAPGSSSSSGGSSSSSSSGSSGGGSSGGGGGGGGSGW